MTEDKISFERKRNLTDSEIASLLQERQGAAVLLHNWPDNTQKVFKIISEPIVKEFEDAENPAVYWNVSWKYKGEPVELLLRTSKSAYDTFMKKKEEQKFEYIGKYSIFAKGKTDKGSYHSVSKPMDKELTEFKDPLDVMNDIKNNPSEDKSNDEELKKRATDFVNEMIKAVGDLNATKNDDEKINITPEIVAAKYLRKHYRVEYDTIKEIF